MRPNLSYVCLIIAAALIFLGAAAPYGRPKAVYADETPRVNASKKPGSEPPFTYNLKASDPAPVYKIEVLEERPHNPEVFTQGFFFNNGLLYESSGLYQRSAVYAYDFSEITPQGIPNPVRQAKLPSKYFAEGAAIAEDKLFVLTWREGVALILNPDDFTLLSAHTYQGEGWGLCYDGRYLWRSDGTAVLTRHAPDGFQVAGELIVKNEGNPVPLLNELEWDKQHNLILANVFTTVFVAAINPDSGQVEFWLDASELAAKHPAGPDGQAVLNGLGINPADGSLWLTGKLWTKMYKVAWPPSRHPAPLNSTGSIKPAQ